jgi:hypothetical protein
MHFIQAVVVANSYKKSGRCLAVIDLQTSALLRPVTDSEHHEVPTEQSFVIDGRLRRRLEPGDFVLVPLSTQDQRYWQRENWFLDVSKQIGLIEGDLEFLRNRANKMFNETSHSPDYLLRSTDRSIETIYATRDHPSLELRLVLDLRVSERDKGNGKKQLRARFKYKDMEFDFPYTGEQELFKDGSYADRAMVCLSLAEEFPKSKHYKLVAGIIKLGDRR